MGRWRTSAVVVILRFVSWFIISIALYCMVVYCILYSIFRNFTVLLDKVKFFDGCPAMYSTEIKKIFLWKNLPSVFTMWRKLEANFFFWNSHYVCSPIHTTRSNYLSIKISQEIRLRYKSKYFSKERLMNIIVSNTSYCFIPQVHFS